MYVVTVYQRMSYIYIRFARTAICSVSSFTADDISIFEEIEEVVLDDDTTTNRDSNIISVLAYDMTGYNLTTTGKTRWSDASTYVISVCVTT